MAIRKQIRKQNSAGPLKNVGKNRVGYKSDSAESMQKLNVKEKKKEKKMFVIGNTQVY